MRRQLLFHGKSMPVSPKLKESYFSVCERDKGGHCLPSGKGSEKKVEKGSITVKWKGSQSKIDKEINSLVGKELSNEEIKAISFGVDGSSIKISKHKEGGIYLNQNHDGVNSEGRLYKDDGKLVYEIINISIDKNSSHKGKGLDLFISQVESLKKLGVQEIHADARGFKGKLSNQNGYYTWPRMGFEGEIRPIIFSRLSKDIQKKMGQSRNILDLYEISGGKEEWLSHGGDIDGTVFDLSDNSRSMKVLKEYIKEKGK